jgi:hypothetical protein
MSELSAALTPKRVAAGGTTGEKISQPVMASGDQGRSFTMSRPTITGAAFSQRLLSCASGPFAGPILKVAFGSI